MCCDTLCASVHAVRVGVVFTFDERGEWIFYPKLVRTRHLMSAQRGVYEARDGSVRNDMGTTGGWCVGQDLTQACRFQVVHA